ncbi:ATP-binding protein [Synechococcus sp. Cruz CV12-2-Slac-r]|uniref:ATP-binding protein n=1 Tax=Synechococcus sp. Cruz CV12-2-Slac-r TaxID=2823748 RepID=UPI0020CFAE5E|nr:ATP-binding protein [Synechococcus sp. Cruz CV12-2-Slac-r]MCP9938921.1 histidine kinase [Synechococcus sp. Cruz CV12-2-Slac-r]
MLLRFILFLTLGWALSLGLLQQLLGQRLERAQMQQLGRNLAEVIKLSQMVLERFPPALVAELSGLPLATNIKFAGNQQGNRDRELRLELCKQLRHCPEVRPNKSGVAGVWVELLSPLEPVWLYVALPSNRWWPPDPMLASYSLISGTVIAGALFLLLEVQRPLHRLENALGRVGLEQRPAPLPKEGAVEVQRLSGRFNSMLARLEASETERATMLAGIAHDLKSPITRLRLRLAVESASPQAQADLDALERITGQFLLFAGGGQGEQKILLPLNELIGELSARYDDKYLELFLQPLQALVQPVALSRALANLIDNALCYGAPPLVIQLMKEGSMVLISITDQGDGICQSEREQALMPFHRLDSSRSGSGHCGLGLAIASRVAELHGGKLEFRDPPDGGFSVCLLLSEDLS